MKNILLLTTLAMNFLGNNVEKLESKTFSFSSAKINNIQTKKEINLKYDFDKNKILSVFQILKSEFNDIPNLVDNKLLYQFEDNQTILKIKIKNDRIIIKYSSSNPDEDKISEKTERIKEKLKNI